MGDTKITAVQKAYARLLREKEGTSYSEIAKRCKISKASSYRICNMPINSIGKEVDKVKGRPRKLSDRDVRALIRSLKVLRMHEPNLSVRSLVTDSELSLKTISRRTYSRVLNENGYGFLQRRKKGISLDRDRKLR